MRRHANAVRVFFAFAIALACALPARAANPALDPLSLAPDPTTVALAHQTSTTIGAWVITATSTGHGSITPSGSIWVTGGTSQTFTLTPDSCFSTSDLLVDGLAVGMVSSYTFTNVTGPHSITANFAPLALSITASAGTGGSISPAGVVTLTCGGAQTYTITPTNCYRIADVLVDGVSQGAVASYTFTGVIAPHTIAARFVIRSQYTLSASAASGGEIYPSGDVVVNCGGNQTFTITPYACSTIADVQVDGVSVGARSSYTFTSVLAGHTIAASFAPKSFTITASAGSGGTISPSGTIVVTCGSSLTFTLTPDTCAQVGYLLVDGLYVGTMTSYTLPSIGAAHSLYATFLTPELGVMGQGCGAGLFTPSVYWLQPSAPNTTYGVDLRSGCTIPAVGTALTFAGTVTTDPNGVVASSTLPCVPNGVYTVILDHDGNGRFDPHCDAYGCFTLSTATPTLGLDDVQATLAPDGPALSWWVADRSTYRGFRIHRAAAGEGEVLVTPQPLVPAATAASAPMRWVDATAVAGTTYAYRIEALETSGADWYGPYTLATPALPHQLAVRNATPNPARGTVRLAVDVPTGGAAARLDVYDVAGRHVRTLAGGLAPGAHVIEWDGRDDAGARTRGGVYLVRAQTGAASAVAHVVRVD